MDALPISNNPLELLRDSYPPASEVVEMLRYKDRMPCEVLSDVFDEISGMVVEARRQAPPSV
jgi:hypothetical protein